MPLIIDFITLFASGKTRPGIWLPLSSAIYWVRVEFGASWHQRWWTYRQFFTPYYVICLRSWTWFLASFQPWSWASVPCHRLSWRIEMYHRGSRKMGSWPFQWHRDSRSLSRVLALSAAVETACVQHRRGLIYRTRHHHLLQTVKIYLRILLTVVSIVIFSALRRTDYHLIQKDSPQQSQIDHSSYVWSYLRESDMPHWSLWISFLHFYLQHSCLDDIALPSFCRLFWSQLVSISCSLLVMHSSQWT
jgi:hypothetical protein